jgi:CzcA family heavy metal efflux pump
VNGDDLFTRLDRQRTLILTITVGLMFAGVLSLWRLGSGIYPEVEFLRIVVVARTGDMPPEQMQASVVRPLEEALATVIGVRRIRTRIIRGAAEIALQFSEGTDMWRSLQLADAALGRARDQLPPGTEVESQKVTPADFPILSFNLIGGTPTSRREAAEFIVRPAFSRAAGVGRVEVVGGDPREVEVVVDPARLATLRLRPSQIAQRVGNGIVRRAVGRFDDRRQLVTVMAETRISDPVDLRRLPVASGPNGSIALGDVAQVFDGAPDRTLAVHAPEGEAVQVSISRVVGASAPDVVREVQAIATALRLPEEIRLVQVYNQGELIHESILGIRDAIMIGIILTVGVLAFFLRDVRAGLLAALSVPVTLLVTFLAVLLTGQTLNLMSLGGLAVAIGLVIDDAIVVVEAITRRIDDGEAPALAAREGLREMTAPVVGTTVTTVVVFVPLAFLSGLVGDFFAALALTLVSAVLISLLFAVFVLPLIAARFLRPRPAERAATGRALGARYAWTLRRVLQRPVAAAAGVGALVALGALVAPRIPSGFLPEMDEGAFVLDYFLPAGTSLEATDAAALRIESILGQTAGVANWTRRTGAELGPVTATQLSRGDIAVLLKPRRSRRDAEEIIDEVRGRVERELPGVRVEFVQILEDVLNDLAGDPRPLEVRLLGEDQTVLTRLAGEVERRIQDVPHLVDYYRGVEGDVPVLRYVLLGDAAERAGLTAADVGEDLATALRGSEVGSVPRLDRLVPVRVRFPDEVRFQPEALASWPIALGSSAAPISALARVVEDKGASVLLRENLSPAAIATGDVEGGNLGGLVQEVRRRLLDLPLPPGYRVEVGGRAESQARAFRQLAIVLVLGILVVFAVLVAQFHAARAALLVLLTVPPALAGGILFLALSRVPLNVSSLMGLVLLVGLVVKNGVLLIGVALDRMRAGTPLPAALAGAGRRRLRPILMTTLCTIFGLLPLALSLGAGSELQRPLAVAVIGGLLFSTVATLYMLPALAKFFLRSIASPARPGGAPGDLAREPGAP